LIDWHRGAFLPSNKPFLHNRFAFSRMAPHERRSRMAICAVVLVGHMLTSVLISSLVQSLTSLLVMSAPACHVIEEG
jgi:hypothetical protein